MNTRKDKNELSNLMSLKNQVRISEKIFLTVPEASALSGIAYNQLYTIINKPDCDFVVKMKGQKKNFIHREKFERYLADVSEL